MGTNRRDFLKTLGGVALFTIVPRHVLGKGYIAPSDQLTKGIIGTGGMGRGHVNYAGTRLVAVCDVDKNHLELGKNFDANNGFNCICKGNISFGSDCLLGWDVTVLDSDGHRMVINGESVKEMLPVNIGSNVWMGAKTTVLKGSCIKDNTVVGYGTLVSGSYDDNSIIVGGKGKSMKKDSIIWMK